MAYVTNIKTVITYDLDNTTKTFTIPFEYLSRTFVVVTLIGIDRKVLENITDYTFATSTQITTKVAWGSDDGYDQIEIRRQTSASERIVDFQNGSVLRADDLNVSQIQSLHVAEEARDLVSDTIGTDNDGNLDARGRKIINLADGVNDGDAVNLRQQKTWASSALNQADRAKTEADRAQNQANLSTTQANYSAQQAATATTAATAAVSARNAALTSETNAKTSETNAQAAQNGAYDFQNAAHGSMVRAETSANSAEADADRAQTANPDNQLKKANNLSDVSSVATSRTNLSVYSKAEVDTAISKSGGGYVSQVMWHHSRNNPVDGTVVADGQLLSRSVYPDLWEAVRTNKVPVVTETQWSVSPGSRGAYTTGDGSTTFRVPDYNGAQSGSIAAPFLRGGIVSTSSLVAVHLSRAPNITGVLGGIYGETTYIGLQSSGAFTSSSSIGSKPGISTSWSANGASFDASRSNAVYGRDNTTEVSPNFVDGVYIIRAAGSVINSGNIDANALASAISDLSSRVTTLESNAKNLLSTAWAECRANVVQAGTNISGFTRTSAGVYDVQFTTPMYTAAFVVHTQIFNSDTVLGFGFTAISNRTVNGFRLTIFDRNGTAADAGFMILVHGGR